MLCPKGALRVKPGLNSLKIALEEVKQSRLCKAEDLSVNTNVNARFKTNGAYNPGKISKMNKDGTYDITFDDGENRKNTPFTEIEVRGIEEIYLENGVHMFEVNQNQNYVNINISITVIGESRLNCKIIGGFNIQGKKEDNVNIHNVTVSESMHDGVTGGIQSASIHLDNVSVENSGSRGVIVYGSKRNTMKNCNVSHSKHSGLGVFNGGLMTIDGNDTTIHHNGTDYDDYGLCASSTASIHLVSPLTKEMISKNNGGGGNHGGHGTIKTMTNNTKEAKK